MCDALMSLLRLIRQAPAHLDDAGELGMFGDQQPGVERRPTVVYLPVVASGGETAAAEVLGDGLDPDPPLSLGGQTQGLALDRAVDLRVDRVEGFETLGECSPEPN